MNYVEKFFDGVQTALNLNPATFSGACDVIVVKGHDGVFRSTEFHVRFGKLKLLSSSEKAVQITVNSKVMTDLKMKLGKAGEAYFVMETNELPTTSSPVSSDSEIEEKESELTKKTQNLTVLNNEAARTSITDVFEEALLKNKPKSTPQNISSSPSTIHSVNVLSDGVEATSPLSLSPEGSSDSRTSPESKARFFWQIDKQQKVVPKNEENKEHFVIHRPQPTNRTVSQSTDSSSYLSENAPRDTLIQPESSSSIKNDQLVTTSVTPGNEENVKSWKTWGIFKMFKKKNKNERENTKSSEIKFIESQMEQITKSQLPLQQLQQQQDSQGPKSELKKCTNLGSDEEQQTLTLQENLECYKTSNHNLFLLDEETPLVDRYSSQNDKREPTQLSMVESNPSIKSSHQLERKNGQILEKKAELNEQQTPKSPSQESKSNTVLDHSNDTVSRNTLLPARENNRNDNEKNVTNNVMDKRTASMKGQSFLFPLSRRGSDVTPSFSKDKLETIDWEKLQLKELNIEISECGHIIFAPNFIEDDKNNVETIFKEKLISFEKFSENPEMLFNADIAFRIQGRILPWRVAAPLLISLLAFHKPPDIKNLAKVLQEPTISEQKGDVKSRSWMSWLTFRKKTESPNLKPVYTVRSLKPTSDQIMKMDLKKGPNKVSFAVSSGLQGRKVLNAVIYLWDPDTKIVVSDIDGTITKTDVFGQILPHLGKDWTHSGIVDLLANVKANGYEMLYLTARAIGQADLTRDFLNSLRQDDNKLPEGPLLMSRDRLFSSLNREMILRRPEQFKIACLQDIASLFPPNVNPFYAGFGNRTTDVISYEAVGIPPSKIFVINEFSEILIPCGLCTKSYASLNELVDEMFPPVTKSPCGEQEQ